MYFENKNDKIKEEINKITFDVDKKVKQIFYLLPKNKFTNKIIFIFPSFSFY